MKPIKLGLEIECLVNDDLSILRGDYHHGISVPGLPGWKAENDSSIYRKEDDNFDGEPTEFVSKTVTNKKDFFKLLENFQDFFVKKGKIKLNDSLLFNSTCGAHVHFSMKGMKFRTKTIWKVFRETRNLFIKLLGESQIASKKEIFAQYYRSYARKCTRSNYTNDRRSEFNFESEWENRGMEWRSINLHQVKSWKDFFKLFEIVWTCLNFLGETAEKYSEQRTITVKPQTKELKSLKSEELNSVVYKNNILKEEEIILTKERLFSKEGEPQESKEMVKLRLKHISNIKHIKKNTITITTTNIKFARNELRRMNILTNGQDYAKPVTNYIAQHLPEGATITNEPALYNLTEIGYISRNVMITHGWRRPTLNSTKKLLISGSIFISTDIIGSKCLCFKEEEEEEYYE